MLSATPAKTHADMQCQSGSGPALQVGHPCRTLRSKTAQPPWHLSTYASLEEGSFETIFADAACILAARAASRGYVQCSKNQHIAEMSPGTHIIRAVARPKASALGASPACCLSRSPSSVKPKRLCARTATSGPPSSVPHAPSMALSQAITVLLLSAGTISESSGNFAAATHQQASRPCRELSTTYHGTEPAKGSMPQKVRNFSGMPMNKETSATKMRPWWRNFSFM
mmetsp:Transcript_87090/g.251546  ORF Transcript_87090/g.251546 Transcript_87090/m.251546 type:complete len:227 (-) Transcript_87090:18-698(-)